MRLFCSPQCVRVVLKGPCVRVVLKEPCVRVVLKGPCVIHMMDDSMMYTSKTSHDAITMLMMTSQSSVEISIIA